jgi:putative nucleotidyltransferase with HDIG domain
MSKQRHSGQAAGHTQPDLTPYAGRWVAIVRGRVVGVGLTPEEARLVAKRNRHKEEPTLLFVEGGGRIINPDAAPPSTLLAQVVELLRGMGTPAYLVGGAVRDWLLSSGGQAKASDLRRRGYDLDFAVPDDGLRIARRIADELGAAFYPLDAQRDVGRVVLTVDSALRKRDEGGVEIVDVARFQGPDLMADLAGRDFTINAMALDVTHDPPPLLDPHGGQADLEARQLRAVSDQAIHNDPVRGLRAVRLGAELGFEIEPHTQRLIRDAAPSLSEVSAERMRDELIKILSLPAVADSLRQLDALNLLAEVLPEVTALKGLAQTGRHHWDAYEHTLQTAAALEALLPLDGAPLHTDIPFPDQVADHYASSTVAVGGGGRRSLLTLAALLHDVGKRDTAMSEPDGQIRFIGHERVGAKMAAEAMRRLRFSGEATRLVEAIVRHHLRPLQLAWQGVASKRAIHRFFRDAGDAGVEIALLSLADHWATVGPGVDDQYPDLLKTVRALLDTYFNHRQMVVAPPPLLTGHDLIHQFGLAQGPEIGRLLAALQEAQAIGQVTNRQQAEAWVKRRLET